MLFQFGPATNKLIRIYNYEYHVCPWKKILPANNDSHLMTQMPVDTELNKFRTLRFPLMNSLNKFK